MKVYLIGPGRLGSSLLVALRDVPPVSVIGVAYHSARGQKRAERYGREGLQISDIRNCAGIADTDAILLTVKDDLVGSVASEVGPRLKAHQVLLHSSGSLSSLDLGEQVAARGSWHPLQSFADPNLGAQRFRDCFVAVEGDTAAVELGAQLAQHLGATPTRVRTEGKAAYHAAAAVASNYLVALTEVALRLTDRAGIDRPLAQQMLLRLQQGTLDNLRSNNPAEALTGPIARGDAATVKAHIAAMEDSPSLSRIYRQLGQIALELSESTGLDPESASTLAAILS